MKPNLNETREAIVNMLMKEAKMGPAEAQEFVSSGEIAEVSEDLYMHTYPMDAGVMRRDVYKQDDKEFRRIAMLQKNVAEQESDWSEFKG
jgi:hypothetical protein